MDKWKVTITCVSKDSIYNEYQRADCLVDAVNLLLTYEPKTGFKMIEYFIEKAYPYN